MNWLVARLICSIIIHQIASCDSINNLDNIINITFGNTIIWLYSQSIIRVTHLPPKIYDEPSFNSIIVNYNGPISPINYNESTSCNNVTTLMTDSIGINIDHNNKNRVSFIKKSNKEYLLSESQNVFVSHNDSVLDFSTYKISQQWTFHNEYTSIYGWGQYQNGFINYRDATVRCIQFNTEICIPFLITNNDYGILWDNPGLTHLNIENQIRFNNWSNIIVTNNGSSKNLSSELQCDNNIHFDTSSGYHFYIDFSQNNPFEFGAHSSSYWAIYIDDQIYDYWTKGFNPSTISTKPFNCNKGKILKILFVFDDLKTPNNIENYIYYNKPSMSFDIESYEAPYIDYYFIYGNNIDDIIGDYRMLSGGAVPMYSLNIFGFWQCKNTYNNESAMLQSASEFRIRGLPLDNIVQDINYWGDLGQGPHFDPLLFPNTKHMVDELHAMNLYVMITVHPDFATNTIFYNNMSKQQNYLIPNTSFTNFYNENAAKQMYQFINDSMYSVNIDYIWLDSTEPTKMFNMNNSLKYVDIGQNIDTVISGNYYLNSYSLFDTKWMYKLYINDEYQANKRYFSLTRSQFAGQHIYGTTVWSGDINSNWDQFKRQISAGINYMISGNPYWTNDIGGFWRNGAMQYNDSAYQYELIRWFQFGAFLPIFRVHGFHSNTEYWNYGKYAEESILLMDNLRYRLLPYIYTINYLIYKHHYTMTRALIFDFCCNDNNIHNIFEQFMFGPYMLISLILQNNITNIYLPGVNDANKYRFWYDFWNGSKYDSGKWLEHYYSPTNIVPIHVHSGSILIFGPFVQYSTQIPWIELEIRIYDGNNANFTLFEDDGFERNSVQNNHYTLITFIWNDKDKVLIISKRHGGTFNGMLRERLFNLVLVDTNHGVGANVTKNVDKSVKYIGKEIQIQFET